MRHLTLILLLLLTFSAVSAAAQDAVPAANPQGVVESYEISGVPEDDVSQAVRGMMQKLVGQKFDQQAADDLVDRIQIELPGFIATTKLVTGADPDRVKVVFVVEKSNEEPGRRSNINSRYPVEDVEIDGIDESRISKAIRDDMRKLVGQMLDHDLANSIEHRLQVELQPRYSVHQRVVRGRQSQHLIVVYEIRKVPWIRVAEFSQYITYHSKQHASVSFQIPIEMGSSRLLLGMVNDQDHLIERFAGYRVGYENLRLGTDRLGIGLHYLSTHEQWQPATVAASRASPDAPGIYRERRSFDPSVTFAFDPRLKLNVGVNLSDLQIQYPEIHWQHSNAAVASLSFNGTWENSSGERHEAAARYEISAANHKMDSDFIYTRHLGKALYAFGRGRKKVTLSFTGGAIAGRAPLYERFSLGDTTTLRGWNKFDITPLGGNRVVHGSLQYGFTGPSIGTFTNDMGRQSRIRPGFFVYYDVGAVGDRGSPISTKHAAGFGFGAAGFYTAIGFPLRSGHVVPTFIVGTRF